MKISIIIPLYNAEKYIKECLDSIFAQTEQDFELIIVNDASIDKSAEIIMNYNAKNVNLVNLDKNLGQFGAGPINIGLKLVTGEYITWISADDYLCNINAFEILSSELDNNKDLGLVSAQYKVVGNQNIEVSHPTGIITFEMLKKSNYICSSFLFRKECIDKVGFIDTTLIGAEDWDYWIRFSKHFKIKKIEPVLYHWRKHNANFSANPVANESISKIREKYR